MRDSKVLMQLDRARLGILGGYRDYDGDIWIEISGWADECYQMPNIERTERSHHVVHLLIIDHE